MAAPADTVQTSDAAAGNTSVAPPTSAQPNQRAQPVAAAMPASSSDAPGTSGPPGPSANASPTTSTTARPSFPDPVVYLPGSSSSASSSAASLRTAPAAEAEPKPTADELKAAYASTIERNRRMGVGPDAPLMTQAMRERQEARMGGAAKAKKGFEEVRIRIRFPDRTMLEYTLPSTTSVAYLYPLLRSALDPSIAKSKPFTLYTSPPKIDFPESDLLGTTPAPKKGPARGSGFSAGAAAGAQLRGKKIGEMGWGGAVVINIRWTGAGDEAMNSSGAASSGSGSAGSSTKSRLGFGGGSKDSSSGGAAAVTAPIREDLKARARELEPPKMGVQAEGASGSTASGSKMGGGGQTLGGGPGADASKEKKVPKWFKGFKK